MAILSRDGEAFEEYEKALEAFKKTISVNPKFAEAYKSLFLLYNVLRDDFNAAQILAAFTEADPGEAETFQEMVLKTAPPRGWAG